MIWGGVPSQTVVLTAATDLSPGVSLSARSLGTFRGRGTVAGAGSILFGRGLGTFTGRAPLVAGTTVALSARIRAGARAKTVPLVTLTLMRARIRAGGRAKTAMTIPIVSLPLTTKIRAGGRANFRLGPIPVPLHSKIRAGARMAQFMSGALTPLPVFPAVPIGYPVSMTPTFANVEGMIPSGRRIAFPEQQFPIWDFELNLEVLRDQTQNAQSYAELATYTEFTQLVQLFISRYGEYGQFLFDAWWDDSRTDQIIGTGNATETQFLLQRTWGYGGLQFTEPVGAVNALTNVKIDGELQDPSTYRISNNLVTFNFPPSLGAQITATFSYYYLCQWSDDQHDYSEFLKNINTAKVRFRSILPEVPVKFITFPFPRPAPPPPPAPRTPGFYYFEATLVQVDAGRVVCVGIANSSFILGPPPGHQNPYDVAVNAQQPNSIYGCCPIWGSAHGGNAYGYPVRGPQALSSNSGDVVGVALDTVKHLMWIRNCTVNPNVWHGGALGGVVPPNFGFDTSANIPTGDIHILIGCAWNPYFTTPPIIVTLNAGASAFAAAPPSGAIAWDTTGQTTINPGDTDYDSYDVFGGAIALSNGNLTMTCTSHIGGPTSFIGSTHGRSNTSKQQA